MALITTGCDAMRSQVMELRKVHIWEFSRLNFNQCVLSKRKIQWFVDEVTQHPPRSCLVVSLKFYTDSGEKVWEGCSIMGKGLEGAKSHDSRPAMTQRHCSIRSGLTGAPRGVCQGLVTGWDDPRVVRAPHIDPTRDLIVIMIATEALFIVIIPILLVLRNNGLSSKAMALITSDCGATRSLGIKWP